MVDGRIIAVFFFSEKGLCIKQVKYLVEDGIPRR